ncbi:GTP:AMP phosphotransferase, mitochondrial [Cyberlindnera fabianii]|uniref:GTP:AMP phosphotransferase, mitochondrial n=1 Tax=Cyberlindnera fabianii TaxID=36022 RepID=A0A1V2KZB3_CYBFA|nr:GTP:AMP phosphotransferase, mitochondrial [Cyberlindnera fabianii]
MSLARPLRVLLLGAPGSGKGTQTSKLLKHMTLPAISSGDLLRREIQQGTAIGQEAKKVIADGGLLPDETISTIIVNELQSQKLLTEQSDWLLDGFPRTLNQAKILERDLQNAQLNLVVELKVPESVILNRIENRWVHIPSGRVYNLEYSPPKVAGKDDVTGEPLSKRPDDTAAVFQKRLDTYHSTIGPVIEFYKKKGVLRSVEGETSDVIFPKLLSLIKNEFDR